MLLCNVTCYTNYLLSHIHVDTLDLLCITCTLVATCMIFKELVWIGVQSMPYVILCTWSSNDITIFIYQIASRHWISHGKIIKMFFFINLHLFIVLWSSYQHLVSPYRSGLYITKGGGSCTCNWGEGSGAWIGYAWCGLCEGGSPEPMNSKPVHMRSQVSSPTSHSCPQVPTRRQSPSFCTSWNC